MLKMRSTIKLHNKYNLYMRVFPIDLFPFKYFVLDIKIIIGFTGSSST